MSQAERYPVMIDGTPEQLRHLAECGAVPHGEIIMEMTEEQYRAMPGAQEDIRAAMAVRMDAGDGLEYTQNWAEARYRLENLLEHYRSENPGTPFTALRDPAEAGTADVLRLIRATGSCLNGEGKFRPGETGQTVTQIMADEGLDPGAMFREGGTEPR